MKINQFTRVFIQAAISILILSYFFSIINFNLLFSKLKSAETYFLIISLLLVFVIFIVRSYIFERIINNNKKKITFKESFYLNLIGSSLNIFLPVNMGDIAKSYYGFKRTNLKEEIVSSSIVDLAVSLAAVFLIGIVSSLFFNIYYSLIFTFLFLMFIVLFSNKFFPKLFFDFTFRILNFFFLNKLKKNKLIDSFILPIRLKIYIFLLSIFHWILLYIQFYFICKMFALDVSIIYILTIGPLITLARLFPFTFNGLGSREVIVVYFFNIIGINPTLATLASLTYYVFNLIPGLFGIPLLFTRKFHN